MSNGAMPHDDTLTVSATEAGQSPSGIHALPQSRWAVALLCFIAAYLVLSYGLMLLDERFFDPMIAEDAWIESVGAIAFLTAAAFFALCSVRLVTKGRFKAVSLKAAVLLGLSVVLFVGAGEEISWGQRLLGFATPESLQVVNSQDEFNVHNIQTVGRLAELFFALLWGSFALAIPIAHAMTPRVAHLLDKVAPVIPVWLGMLFALNYVVAKMAYAVIPASGLYESIYPAVHSVTEIKETNFAVLFALAAAHYWYRTKKKPHGPMGAEHAAVHGP